MVARPMTTLTTSMLPKMMGRTKIFRLEWDESWARRHGGNCTYICKVAGEQLFMPDCATSVNSSIMELRILYSSSCAYDSKIERTKERQRVSMLSYLLLYGEL